jgi:hypothetical protein
MPKKKGNTKHTNREMNAFPFLSMSLKERLKKSGNIDLTNNHNIFENGDYLKVVHIDKSKKSK